VHSNKKNRYVQILLIQTVIHFTNEKSQYKKMNKQKFVQYQLDEVIYVSLLKKYMSNKNEVGDNPTRSTHSLAMRKDSII
jgi:hypothetical protein